MADPTRRERIAGVVGSVTGVLTTASFIPQVVQSWQTHRTTDLSVGTLVLLVVQAVGWLAYGILIKRIPVIATNACVTVATLLLLIAKWRFG